MLNELQYELQQYSEQLIACAALLLATVIFWRMSATVRTVVFVVVFSTGLLAGMAAFAKQSMIGWFG